MNSLSAAGATTQDAHMPESSSADASSSFSGYLHTNVDMGDHKINCGWKDRTQVIRELWGKCYASACDIHAFSIDTQIVVDACCGNRLQEGFPLGISAGGECDGWESRDAFVHAVVAAAGEGQVWTKEKWRVKTRDGVNGGKVWEAEETDFISVNRFGGDGAMRGYMWVSFTNARHGGSGWCPASMGALAAIARMLDPIAGGFFGVVNAFCSPSK